MKVEYICMKCREKFIVERSGVLDRTKCYNELLEIGKTILFPHFEYHYPDKTDYNAITFDTRAGVGFDFKKSKELIEKIGLDVCYPLLVCRTSWGKRVGFAM